MSIRRALDLLAVFLLFALVWRAASIHARATAMNHIRLLSIQLAVHRLASGIERGRMDAEKALEDLRASLCERRPDLEACRSKESF